MKKDDIYDALSGIDEKYLSASEDMDAAANDFKRAKARKTGIISTICCSLLLFAGAFFFADMGYRPTVDRFTEEIIEPEDPENSEQPIDAAVTDVKDKPTDAVTDKSEKVTVTIVSSVGNNDSTEITTMPLTEPDADTGTDDIPSETPTEVPHEINGGNDHDGLPGNPDLSGYTIEEWLNDDRVVWAESDIKGGNAKEKLPMGTVKISDSLEKLLNSGGDDEIYAVMVDFSSCIDENELNNWEYNGMTIAELSNDIDSADAEKVTAAKEGIKAIHRAYSDMLINGFETLFNINGMGVYTEEWATSSMYFYTFGTRSHLSGFFCDNTMAFEFYPADGIK